MLKAQILSLALLAFFVSCNGEFFIASSPKTMEFAPSDGHVVRRHDLPGVINFLMGLPSSRLHRTESWPGMKRMDVFNPPKANILISVHVPEGAEFFLNTYVMKYTTDKSQAIVNAFEMNSALQSYYGDMGLAQTFALVNQFDTDDEGEIDLDEIRKRLSEESWFMKSPQTDFLMKEIDADVHVFAEVMLLKDALLKINVPKSDGRQSIHIVLTSLHTISEEYGTASEKMKEAISVFEKYIPEFIQDAEDKFKGHLLCEVDVIKDKSVATDELVRHSRSLLQSDASTDGTATNFTRLNLATPTSENYAVIFNICLWLMIAFFLAALAAAYSMWNMDPGKDNIIYRVTSQRMKSE